MQSLTEYKQSLQSRTKAGREERAVEKVPIYWDELGGAGNRRGDSPHPLSQLHSRQSSSSRMLSLGKEHGEKLTDSGRHMKAGPGGRSRQQEGKGPGTRRQGRVIQAIKPPLLALEAQKRFFF